MRSESKAPANNLLENLLLSVSAHLLLVTLLGFLAMNSSSPKVEEAQRIEISVVDFGGSISAADYSPAIQNIGVKEYNSEHREFNLNQETDRLQKGAETESGPATAGYGGGTSTGVGTGDGNVKWVDCGGAKEECDIYGKAKILSNGDGTYEFLGFSNFEYKPGQ